jgi:hypothetical protein
LKGIICDETSIPGNGNNPAFVVDNAIVWGGMFNVFNHSQNQRSYFGFVGGRQFQTG